MPFRVEDKLVKSWRNSDNGFFASDNTSVDIKSNSKKKPKYKTVNEIDSSLKSYQDKGLITEMERDALRHYYGMRSMVKKYGSRIAKIGGYLHEGIDLIFPTENHLQSKIDIKNNQVAFNHLRDNIGIDFSDDMSIDDIRSSLKYLEVPPHWNNGKYK